MEGRYKVTFEINMSDDQKSTLEHYLSEVINTMFNMSPKILKVERTLSEAEKTIMQGTCIDSQAEDQYCETCPWGCIECQRRWLRQLGWKERDLPEKPFPLFGRKED